MVDLEAAKRALACVRSGAVLTDEDVMAVCGVEAEEEEEEEGGEDSHGLQGAAPLRELADAGVIAREDASRGWRVGDWEDKAEPDAAAHKVLVQNAFVDAGGKPWCTRSDYVLKQLAWHLARADDPERVHQLTMNVNWVLVKAARGGEQLDALIAVDMHQLAKVSRKPAELLSRALLGLRQTGALVNPADAHKAKQIVAEYLWNKLSGALCNDRFLHMIVYNCAQLRKGLARPPAGATADESADPWAVASLTAHWPVLASASDPLLHRLRGQHEAFVRSLVYVPDQCIATGSTDGTICVANVDSCAVENRIEGHPGWAVNALAWSPAALAIVSAGADSVCKVWHDAQLVGSFKGHTDSLRCLEVVSRPDGGDVAASGSDDGAVIIWSVGTLESLWAFPAAHSGWCLGLALALRPDGLLSLVSGSENGDLCVWGAIDPAQAPCEPQRVEHHPSSVNGICFVGTEARRFVTASSDRTLCVWDLSDEAAPTVVCTLRGHKEEVRAVTVSDDLAFSVSGDRTVRVWKLSTGDCVKVLKGHADSIACLAIVDSEGDRDRVCLATGADDGDAFIWLVDTQSIRIKTVASTDSAASEDEPPTPPTPPQSQAPAGGAQAADASALAPEESEPWRLAASVMHSNADYLFIGARDGSVAVHVLAAATTDEQLRAHTAPVSALASNETVLVSGGQDYLVAVWTLGSWECAFRLQGHLSGVTALHLEADVLVTAAKDSKIMAWDVATGKRQLAMRGHRGQVTALSAFTGIAALEIDRLVLSASSDGSIRGWDLSSGQDIRIMTGHEGAVLDVQLFGGEPGAERCISFGADRTVRTWDLVWGQPLETLCTMASPVVGLAVDLGRRAFAISAAGQARGWDATGAECFAYDASATTALGKREVTAMTLLRLDPARPVLAAAIQPAKAVIFIDPARSDGELLCNSLTTLGPLDAAALSGPLVQLCAIPSPAAQNERASGTAAVALACATEGFGILDVVVRPAMGRQQS